MRSWTSENHRYLKVNFKIKSKIAIFFFQMLVFLFPSLFFDRNFFFIKDEFTYIVKHLATKIRNGFCFQKVA